MGRKLRKWEKAVAGALAAVFLIAGGFMGIDKFAPEERSLTIVDDDTAAVSGNAAVSQRGDASGKDSGGGEDDSGLDISAKSAILIDGSSGKVLFARNEKEHLPPASVTKVMTLLLILEGCESGKISTEDEVIISERAASMGGSQMYMEPGEKHTVEELLKGVIMVSANDGCVALAEHLSGSVESFVELMNQKAAEMGLEDSHFVNTNGLPVANHYSCAYDIGMISRELMEFEDARDWFTAWQEDIKVGLPGKESDFTLTNTNKLIKSYSGAIGVKTGFTDDAGYCLAGAAERDSTRLISVVLGCESSEVRFDEAARLLDHGFAGYETVQLAKAGERIEKVAVQKGDQTEIFAVSEDPLGVTVKKGEKDQVKKLVEIDENLELPIEKGEKVGFMVVLEGDEETARYRLVSDRKVERADFATTYIRMIKKMI